MDLSPASDSKPAQRAAEGTIDKAIDVLFALHGHAAPRGVTAIGRELGIPKSSAHRVLASLVRRGLVEHDERGEYRLGMALVTLGRGILEREPVIGAARPVLVEVVEALGETCFLVAARNRALVILDKVEGTGFLRAAPEVGATVPVHATAVGKLYLAFAEEQVAGVASTRLERFTEETSTDTAHLAKEIAEARRRGVALNRDEWIEGLTVAAAPVWDERGRHSDTDAPRVAAAIAIAVPSPRARELGERMLEERVMDAARRAEERLAAATATSGEKQR